MVHSLEAFANTVRGSMIGGWRWGGIRVRSGGLASELLSRPRHRTPRGEEKSWRERRRAEPFPLDEDVSLPEGAAATAGGILETGLKRTERVDGRKAEGVGGGTRGRWDEGERSAASTGA